VVQHAIRDYLRESKTARKVILKVILLLSARFFDENGKMI
jgi:hypothetical protein